MRRPALLSAAFFAAGVFMAHRLDVPVWALWTGGLGLWMVCLIGSRSHCAWPGALLLVLGAMRYESVMHGLPEDHVARFAGRDRPVVLDGRAAEEPEWMEDGLRLRMAAERVTVGDTVFSIQGTVLLRFRKFRPDVDYGDRLTARLHLRRPHPPRNPGAFDYRAFLERKGIHAMGSVSRREQVLEVRAGRGGWLWTYVVLPVRRGVRGAVACNLSGGPAGLLSGILLGEKRGVPDPVRTAFTRAGVNHVLAVSGLHVGLIAAVVFFVLGAVGCGRKATAWATVCAVLLYALVTGLPPSVVRAAMMCAIAIWGRLGNTQGEGLNSLGLAALVILIFRPQDLFDVGFQLSFSATAGILIFYRPIRAWLPRAAAGGLAQWLWAPIAVSVAAQVATLPFVLTYFGLLSIVSILANLVVVPLMAAAVALGLLGVIVFHVSAPVASLLNGANWVVLKGAIQAAGWFAAPSWAAVELQRPGWTVIGLYLCAAALILPEVRSGRWGRRLVLVGLSLVNLWVWSGIWQRPADLRMLVLDVGQGDGIFLRFPNGRTLLVDSGLRALNIDMGERVLIPFLQAEGINRIDAMVATHPHSDHIGGFVTLLEKVEVGWYLDAGQFYDSWTARRIRTLIREKGIRYAAIEAGDRFGGLGAVDALVLHPTPDYVSRNGPAPLGLNNGSVVIRLAFGGTAVLLTGDIEHETDPDLLRWGDRLRAQVLKAAHHGSRTSSTAAFLDAVRPDLVAISCGVRNKFRHPSREVIRRYETMGISIYRTDEMGAVEIRIDERGIDARGWLEAP